MNVKLYAKTTPQELNLWGKGYWLAVYYAGITFEADRLELINRLTVILQNEQENEIERYIFSREDFKS